MKKIVYLWAATLLSTTAVAQMPTKASASGFSTASTRRYSQAPLPAGQGGYLLPSGYFSTHGAQIVDGKGIPVRIASVGWYGFETKALVLRGLDSTNYKKTMRALVADGFNTIRLPWCDLVLKQSPASGKVNYTLNPDLKGLTSIQVMDKVTDYANTLGLRIILDHHTDDGGGGQQPNGRQRSSETESTLADYL